MRISKPTYRVESAWKSWTPSSPNGSGISCLAWWDESITASPPNCLSALGTFFTQGKPFNYQDWLTIFDLIGWNFDLPFAKERPDVAVPVKWNLEDHWLIWRNARASQSACLAVFHSPDHFRDIASTCANIFQHTTISWLVVHRFPNRMIGNAELKPHALEWLKHQRWPRTSSNSTVQVVCRISSDMVLLLRSSNAAEGVTSILTFVLLGALCLFVLWLTAPDFSAWSVRAKLAFFLAYICGITLFISSVQNGHFLTIQQRHLELQLQQKAANTLEQFDASFRSFETNTETFLKNIRSLGKLKKCDPNLLIKFLIDLVGNQRILLRIMFSMQKTMCSDFFLHLD